MDGLDLNLLTALEVLLAEESVTGAARQLGLSASAMSRTLTRLRSATGDPLLVRAGRGLVATPHAIALRARVPALVREAQAVLRPAVDPLAIAALAAIFTLRVGEWFMEWVAPPLAADIIAAAPHVRLRFVATSDKDLRHLGDGQIDLEIGAVGALAPEIRTQRLFRDAYVGVVRSGHPLLASGSLSPERFAACQHVAVAQRGDAGGPVDHALAALGLTRTIGVVVPGYAAALRIARATHHVAVVPRSSLGGAPESGGASLSGLESFEVPVRLPDIVVSAMWHPRLDADPAHRWLRGRVIGFCRTVHP